MARCTSIVNGTCDAVLNLVSYMYMDFSLRVHAKNSEDG